MISGYSALQTMLADLQTAADTLLTDLLALNLGLF